MTSSNQLRSGDDLQFAFSYFYFLIHKPPEIEMDEIFKDELDVDKDGWVIPLSHLVYRSAIFAAFCVHPLIMSSLPNFLQPLPLLARLLWPYLTRF